MKSSRLVWIRLLSGVLPIFAVLIFADGASMAAQEDQSVFLPVLRTTDVQAEPASLCRFGVNSPGSVISEYPMHPLRLGWYLNYGASAAPARPNGIEYVPMIRVHQTEDAQGNVTGYTYTPSGQQLDLVIQANPGAAWFIGNEPDRRDWPGGGQDEILPQLYAEVYHELYHYIKSKDPAAKILAGSIVQPTELRLQYLDIVLSTYRSRYGEQMPVDAWSIHNFILNERSCEHYDNDNSICWGAEIPPGIDATDGMHVEVEDNDNFDLFVAQIERFRRWMTERGYRGVPLYLSEYGVLMPDYYGFTPERVNTFMNKTFDYLRTATDPVHGNPADGYRLVQRLSWFSLDFNPPFNGWLFNPESKQLSAMGSNFAAYTATIAEEADFYPVRLDSTPPFPPSGPVDLTLKATLANSGNTAAAHDIRVRFYNGNPAAGGTQIGGDQAVSLAGCGDTASVEVTWTDVPSGSYHIYVSVEPVSGSAPEPAEAKANNTYSRLLLVGGKKTFLPILRR